jgi:opacity protein-like surface antigen
MKKVGLVLIVLLFLGFNLQAQGQMNVGLGLELGLPIGDWSDAAGTGIGGTARFEYAFTKQIVGMITAGYLSFGGDEVGEIEWSYSAIPFLPGVKYYFQPGLYGMAELGFHFFSVDVESPSVSFGGVSYGGGSYSESSTEISLSLGAGYETKIGDNLILDLNAKLAIVSDANYLGVRAGVKMPLDKLTN